MGIDPGTTSAYAALNLEGEIKEIHSSKEMELSEVIRRISETGHPVIVASDKRTVPEFVKQFSRKTSARLVKFGQDLQVEAKRELTKGQKVSNDHERDALASAMLAFKRHRALIDKIKRYVSLHGKENIKNDIANYVLTKEISIDLAVKLIEANTREVKVMKKVVEGSAKQENYLKLIENLNKKLEENELLKEENKELKSKLKKEQEENKKLRNKSAKETKELKIRSKDQYINNLENTLEKNLKGIKELKQELDKLYKLIPGDYVTAKRLQRLTKHELNNKKEFFNVVENDVVFVDDDQSFSNNILQHLSNKNIVLVSKDPVKELANTFTVIKEKELNIKKTRHYCFIDRKEFNKALKNKNILRRVVHNYQKERE